MRHTKLLTICAGCYVSKQRNHIGLCLDWYLLAQDALFGDGARDHGAAREGCGARVEIAQSDDRE